jgi:guanine deaminase
MSMALALARKNAASADGGPFGAIVVHDGQDCWPGRNPRHRDQRSHGPCRGRRPARGRKTLGRFDLKGCVIYTSCEPCPMCLSAAYWARVDRVVFSATQDEAAAAGFDDAFLYDELTKDMADRQLECVQLKTDDEDPFAVWLANPNRIPY